MNAGVAPQCLPPHLKPQWPHLNLPPQRRETRPSLVLHLGNCVTTMPVFGYNNFIIMVVNTQHQPLPQDIQPSRVPAPAKDALQSQVFQAGEWEEFSK